MKTAVSSIVKYLRHVFVSPLLLLVLSTPLAANEMWEDLFKEHLENAKAGQAEAQYEVGIMYLKGQGVAQDRDQAIRWLKASANSGYQLAASKLGRIEEQESKFTELQAKAEGGDLEAQYELAMMYLKGRGIDADESKARRWLQKAADSNDARAITRLGILNYKAEGGNTNYKQALSLFKRVSGDSVLAQYYLGEMYAEGAGVKKDYEAAIGWYKKAAEGGFNRARGKIINLEEEMKIDQRRQANLAKAEQQRQAALAEKQRQQALAEKQKQRAQAEREASRVAAVSQPVATQPAPVKAAPKPVLTALDRLAGRQWVRGDRPVDYLPSEVTQCDRDDDALVCFSKVLTRVTGTQTVQYRVKSFVRTDKDSFVISYRNLVLDVTDSQEPEDQPLGYDDQVEQGFRIQTGWTPEHTVRCEDKSGKGMRCVKDNTHKMTLAFEG